MNEVLAFSLVALLLVISPGPNGVLILKTIANNPKSSALINVVGIACATFVHGGLSIFGLSALVMQSAELFMLIKLLGAAYLFYIGIKAIYTSFNRSKKVNQVENIQTSAEALINAAAECSSGQQPKIIGRGFITFFNEGFLTQLLNPKVSMFYLAAFPQFIGFDEAHITTAFLFVAIHAVFIISWFTSLIFVVDKLKSLQQQKESWLNRWTQRLSGTVMIYFSLLIVSQR